VSDSVIDGGSGTDTVSFAASGTIAATLAGLEALNLTGGAAITMSQAQFAAGFAANSTLGGSGSMTVNMGAGDLELYLQTLVGAAGVGVTINGSADDNIIKGVIGSVNAINGGDGADQIRGGSLGDIINGGIGDDKLNGAAGADIMTGGAGADTFRFQFAGSSGVGAAADQITDFAIGTDKLAFALIDADAVTPGDQAFAFLGTGAFSAGGVGQIRYQNSGANLLVQIDVDGNGSVDMEVVLQGLTGQTLTGASFLL
jgi:Ca2+-binding RTX toxin-like protein